MGQGETATAADQLEGRAARHTVVAAVLTVARIIPATLEFGEGVLK
jgi:hypothetical protein